MILVIPSVPDSCLFPNAARRTNHHVKAAAARPLREVAMIVGIETAGQVRGMLGGAIYPAPERVNVRVCVRWPKGRRMPDLDALGLACKPILDGLTDAKIWDDDRQIAEVCYRQERGDGVVAVEVMGA